MTPDSGLGTFLAVIALCVAAWAWQRWEARRHEPDNPHRLATWAATGGVGAGWARCDPPSGITHIRTGIYDWAKDKAEEEDASC